MWRLRMELLMFQLIWIVPLCCWIGWLFCEIKRKHWIGIVLGFMTAASTCFLFWCGHKHYANYDHFYQFNIAQNTLAALQAGRTNEVTILLREFITPDPGPDKPGFYSRRAKLRSKLRELKESIQQPSPGDSSKAADGLTGTLDS